MSNIDKDIETEKQNQMYENLKYKLKSIQVSGDKDILWNFEAGFLLGILEGYEEELETYKKIAEKLADKLVEIEDGCKHIPTEICNEYSNGRCIQCIIDWARKEVEKDE